MRGKDQQLQIRVTAAEKATIQHAAARAHLDMSQWVLAKLLPRGAERFHELTQTLGREPESDRYTLAEINDLLTSLGNSAFSSAVAARPAPLSDEYLANYVAAMVETAAHLRRIPPPEWTASVAPLARPAFGTALMSLRLHLLLSAPPAFRRRNIFVDASIGDRV